VENYFKDTNAIIERFEFNNKPSIIIKNFSWKKADIVLNWHLDVVPISEENQFFPYEKEWKLFARWAWDMKSWVAIMMKLMKNLINQNFEDKKISLILTTDEEVWWFDWVGKLVELWYIWDIVLIPDGWDLENIVYAEKWIIHLNIEFYWKSVHASRPWLWENAIDNMIKFYNLIRIYIENTKKLYYKKDHWWSSVNLNVVNWGKATNILPDKVNAKFDIRFIEDFKLKDLLEKIDDFLKITNGKIISQINWELLYTDPYNEHIQKYLNIAKKYNKNIILNKEHWASDGRFFAEKGAVVLLHRPNCGNVHWKKEYVELDNLEVIYDIYKNFIIK
jgi:acetylornithine deacetylase/succinyl-diaminopimelate desuccinylase-like protein